MAQIPTSSITMAAIKAETGASATGTLDDCRAASIAYTMTSTSVPGHTRDGTEQTNTNAANWNNTMAEWAGYTHTNTFSSPVYYARNTSSTNTATRQTNRMLENEEHRIASECQTGAITVFYMKLNGNVVEFYAHIDHTNTGSYGLFNTSHSRPTPSWYNTSGTEANFSGSWGAGWTDIKIAQVDTSVDSGGNSVSPSNVKARISSSVFDGVGTHHNVSTYPTVTLGNSESAPNTSWSETSDASPTSGWRVPHASTLYGVAPAALTMPVACFGFQYNSPDHAVQCQVVADNFEIMTLNYFTTRQTVSSESDGCV